MQAQAEAWQFGCFTLKPHRRQLLVDGAPVALSSRAFDILELLVRCHDRVVTRDEIVRHVWRGTNVGEGNLTVQMSALRKVLGEHAGSEPLIVNLPGRGYRIVVEVIAIMPGEPARALPASVAASPKRQYRWIAAAAGIVLALLSVAVLHGIGLDGFTSSSQEIPDARLTIAVQRFTTIGDDARTAALAMRYTESLLAESAQFEELRLFADPEAASHPFPARFGLTGSVQTVGADAVLTVGVTEMQSRRILYRSSRTVSADAPMPQLAAIAHDLLLEIRPALFQAEAALRRGPPRDALDFVIASRVVLGESDRVANLREALSLAEAAVSRDPTNRPARALFALLLTTSMLYTLPQGDDAPGERALALVDGLLGDQPRNVLYVSLRAFSLAALGRLDEAQATAELGLQIEPDDPFLAAKLGEVLMLQGHLEAARTLMLRDAGSIADDTRASIAFAEGHYEDARSLSRQVVAASPGDYRAIFTVLLEVASLSALGREPAAKVLLAGEMALLPERLRSAHAQRQTVYALPDPAWQQLRRSLAEAGMPP